MEREINDYIRVYAHSALSKIVPCDSRVAIVTHCNRGHCVILLAVQQGAPLNCASILPPAPLIRTSRSANIVFTISWGVRFRLTEDQSVGKLEFICRCDKHTLFD